MSDEAKTFDTGGRFENATLLDWFAGQVLNAVYAATGHNDPDSPTTREFAERMAFDCYLVADAMIAEKRRRESGK